MRRAPPLAKPQNNSLRNASPSSFASLMPTGLWIETTWRQALYVNVLTLSSGRLGANLIGYSLGLSAIGSLLFDLKDSSYGSYFVVDICCSRCKSTLEPPLRERVPKTGRAVHFPASSMVVSISRWPKSTLRMRCTTSASQYAGDLCRQASSDR